MFDDIKSSWKFFSKSCNLKVDEVFGVNFSCLCIFNDGSLLLVSY